MVSFQRIEKFMPHLSQILNQVTFAGMYIIVRAALIDGMSNSVYVAYRMALASLTIAPFAYVLERKERKPLTWPIIFQISLLGSGLAITLNCIFPGLYYTSSTFGSAAFNLVPVLTFVMATCLRIETVNIRSLGGQAKVVGTIICVCGAMVMTLYKGPALHVLSPDVRNHRTRYSSKPNILLGTILVFGSVLTWSACIAFQAPILKRYPAQLSLTALMSLIGAVESALMAVILEYKKPNVWAIGWNIELLSIVYSAVVCSAVGMFLLAWCISKRGPVFVALFNPLGTIVTAVLEIIFVHVSLHVGSVVGAILIVVGLYSALWGKTHDMKTKDDEASGNNIIQAEGPHVNNSITLLNNVTVEDQESNRGKDTV
eukprot:PITA_28279